MTQFSYPWAGEATGDAGGYSDDRWSDAWRYMLVKDRTAQGVIKGVDNELEVTGATSPVSVDTGVAIVDGKIYTNDAAETVAIPTPSGGTSRIDLIVLRKDWSAQTVRIARVAGTESGSPSAPSLTQTDGVTWEIKLAEVLINDAGNITVTDARSWVTTPLSELNTTPPIRYVTIECFSFRDEETCETGDGKGWLHIPAEVDDHLLVEAHAEHRNAGSGGNPTLIQIHNVTRAVDVLSTRLQVDVGETGSDTAASGYVIDGDEDHVNENELIRIDFDQLPTTPPEGAMVTLGFQEPD